MNLMRSNSLVWLLLGAGTMALALWLVRTESTFQMLLGLLVVLVLPGYALTEALFSHRQLGWAERILLSVGASLAIVMLGTLLLRQLDGGLQATYWSGYLIIVTLCAAVTAWLVRRANKQIAFAPAPVRLQGRHLLLLGLAVLVTSVAFTTARSAAPAAGFQGYTILWLTPQTTDGANQIQIGVTSKEFTTTAYKVQIMVNDQLAQEWPQLMLAPHQTWQASLEMPLEQAAQSTIETLLYRLDQPETAYRHVVLRPKQ